MKKWIALVLVFVLVGGWMVLPVAAASSVTLTRDTRLTQQFNVYQDLTLAPGVTLTANGQQGIEVYGKLTLGAGAKLAGSGLLLMRRGSSYEGITLYYKFQGEYRTFPDIATAYAKFQIADDFVFEFRYQDAAKGWVWEGTLNGGDPFAPDPDPDQAMQEPQQPAQPVQPPDESYANTLNTLGLLQGVGVKPNGTPDFALDRPLKRVEAVTMMVRLLGKEQEARSGSWSHPFSDVPAWAEPYVGYAYTNGITKGVSETVFGSESAASASMYFTFILRAMGYQDNPQTGPADFSWTEAPYFGRSIGINVIDERLGSFKRAEAVSASFQALGAPCKDGAPLSEKLIAQNVFTKEQYETVMRPYAE